MRKHIGNITVFRSEQTEQNPEREALRVALIKKFGIENAEMEAKKHLEEMSGKREATNAFLFLCDKQGRPPKNISMQEIINQYDTLSGQFKWMQALANELQIKLRTLDAKRFIKDQQAKEQQEKEQETTNGTLYQQYTEGKQHLLNPELQNFIRKALQKTSHSRTASQQAKKESEELRILGICQVEPALRCIFADNQKTWNAMPEDVNEHYLLLKREADWLVAMVAELDSKRSGLRDMIKSAYAYLEGDA